MKRKRAAFVITREQAQHFDGRRAWSARYDVIDFNMGRPIHSNMSVAPPWAKRLNAKTR